MATIPEVVVGFDDEAKALIDRLVLGSSQLEIIPIVGMPGLGKTSFAKKVYSILSSQRRFHIQLWCTVSQVYSVKKLSLDILCSDGEHREENEAIDEGILLDKLRKKLMKNKYLIVFDDIWDDKAWNEVRLAFPDDKNGSRIIFTSRFSNVASQLEHGCEPHALRTLTDGESWDLFQRKVFGEKEYCPEELHEVGKEVVKNCKGLPLSVVIMAGILVNTPYEGWDEVAKQLTRITVYGTDECKHTLELSYIYLPLYLRPCFLYFGAFPEDEVIQSRKLMQLWMAEGFVKCTDGKKLEDLAEEYLMDLIARNLVMVARQRSIGGVKSCYIHDLLHEFCKARAKEENCFVEVLRERDKISTFHLTRLSVWSTKEQFMELCLYCPQLSTLLFFALHSKDHKKRPTVKSFKSFTSLSVLDIEQIPLWDKDFPRQLASHVELRYLAIQGDRSILNVITKLTKLETFHFKSTNMTRLRHDQIVQLPFSFWNMTRLRHLSLRRRNKLDDTAWSLPIENPKGSNSGLLNLDIFCRLRVSLDQGVDNFLKMIPNVRQLNIILYSKPKKTLGNKNTSRLSVSFFNMGVLESLESLQVTAEFPRLREPRNVLFLFPWTLKKLVLKGLEMPWSEITVIEQLPKLEVLKLFGAFLGKRWLLTGGFPELRFLALNLLDLEEWEDTGSDDHFPRLQKLELDGLPFLKSMPSCFNQIADLQVIEVRNCKSSVEDLVRKIEEEQKSYGNESLSIIFHPYEWDFKGVDTWETLMDLINRYYGDFSGLASCVLKQRIFLRFVARLYDADRAIGNSEGFCEELQLGTLGKNFGADLQK